LNYLHEPLKSLEAYNEAAAAVLAGRTPVLLTGVTDTQKCHVASALAGGGPALYITASERAAKLAFEDLRYFLGERVMYCPFKDIIFYNADVRSINITRERLAVLDALVRGESPVVVLSLEALFDRLTPKDVFARYIMELAVGDEISIDGFARKLVPMGYERVDMVEAPGQFAVRGGIVDIFTTLYDNALRVEFWGDEVDSIRLLDSASQRSIDKLEAVRIFPMREFVYSPEDTGAACAKIRADLGSALAAFGRSGNEEAAVNLRLAIGEHLERFEQGLSFKSADRYIGYFYGRAHSLLDYMPPGSLLFFDEPARISEHADSVLGMFAESITAKIEKGYLLPAQAGLVFDYADITAQSARLGVVLLSVMTRTVREFAPKAVCSFAVRPAVTFKQRVDLLLDDLKHYVRTDFKALILCASRTRAQRLAQEIADYALPARFVPDAMAEALKPGVVTVAPGSLNKGFEYQHINLVILSDKELFENEKKKPRRKRSKGSKIESFAELRVGDYVVHDNHGIGIYRGIEQIVADGLTRDYLKIMYSDGGALYVHTSQLDMVQKYIGGDGAKLKLNKLGGDGWARTKARTRQSVAELARGLVELYAVRRAQQGYVYSADNVWQREFEEMFPFEETDDQLAAIEDVKRDMESAAVMDRLVCGDVGYGKTEVAIRAAFKAVQDSKQTAYLVPTTILAQQHYNTFSQRMKDFPVRVELLSRFRSKKDQAETVRRIKSGACDVVIGTHRLLSKDIEFNDLGLVIVDEEQRFGVAHKEKLKSLKHNVDVMTLTATPIPRTLHMSMAGIRDMSILEEPPNERQPVQTYVMEYNPEFVRDAIQRELSREGQVFYLHNRVRNIADVTARLASLVPGANVAYAHGQMPEAELEDIMIDFIGGDIDVLVCTSIIETGLDIPNANTMIIQDADTYGLAQLYQLRGRVGRSNRQAFAYLMYRKDKVLQEDAEKRLQTIREFTEFGSGFRIAMRDMEIRGAGNILGGEQHGHMDAVGYEMYCRLLDEAVQQLELDPLGEAAPAAFETTIEVSVDAHIPGYYISDEKQKLDIYKKISHIKTEQDAADVQDEIEDRFGTILKPVQTLLDVALTKALAHSRGIVSLVQRGTAVTITFKPDADIDPGNLLSLVNRSRGKLAFKAAVNPVVIYSFNKGEEADLAYLRGFLKQI